MPTVPFPEKVMVQTSSRCNASCSFCPYPAVVDSLPQGVMEEALYRRIIDECSEHPGQVERMLLYLMNEPLMDPQIVERINYARKRNPEVGLHILTNGSLLTEKRGDALIDSGLDWIGISVHGYNEEAYERAMGLKRDVTYRRVDRFLEKAIARRGPEFVMVTFNGGGAVTPEERDEEIGHFRDLGVKRISYFGLSISRAGNVPGLAAPRHEHIHGCRSIWWSEMIHILFNGEVILCCMDWKRQVTIGNLNDQSIEALWRSDEYARVRDAVAGRTTYDGTLPCFRCEEAIVESETTTSSGVVDVALVILPCAVMDSDASTVPGVQYAIRAAGLQETLEDLSARVYRRMADELTFLWRRAGHGVVHHGDSSSKLIAELPGEIEWCLERTRTQPADHLLLPIFRSNQAFTLEVVRRIKERQPDRSILIYGFEEEAPDVMREFGVPYHHFQGRDETAAWVARVLGREPDHAPPEIDPPMMEGAAEESTPALADLPTEETALVKPPPPWRPTGWEGTGAGMVPPVAAEGRPSGLSRIMGSFPMMLSSVTRMGRHPIIASRELRRHVRTSVDEIVKLSGSLTGAAECTDDSLSGTPGALKMTPYHKTRLTRSVPQAEEILTEAAGHEPGSAADPGNGAGESSAGGVVSTPTEPEIPLDEVETDERIDEDLDRRRAMLTPTLHDLPAVVVPGEATSSPRRPLANVRPGGDDAVWQCRPDLGKEIDVLLGTLPPWGFANPPVGLAHLASYARQQGYGVEMLDMNNDLYHQLGHEWEMLWHVENKNFWSNETTFDLLTDVIGPYLDGYADIIAGHPAPLVGLSVVDPKERVTIELIKRIKAQAPEKHVILGGPACVTPEYRQIFIDQIPDQIDGYALGEGEQILCDVIEALKKGQDLGQIPGLLCHRDGETLPFRRRKRLSPLDLISFPAYEDFILDRYPGDELIVEWSRGCIGSCTFCKGKMIDGKFRSHSAPTIYAALKQYVRDFGIRRVTVCDPVMNGDVEVLEELCALINEDPIDLVWRGEVIPHSGLSAPLLVEMGKAGCVELQLGVETGSDKVLKLMNKGRLFSSAEAAEVVRNTHAAGIRTALFIIIGFPGEGEDEFMETYNFVKDNAESIDELKSINSLHIITDTPIHIKAERHGLCFPEVDYHYKWYTKDGNTLEVRNDRIRRLKALADELGIFVRETNLAEGKHQDLEQALEQEERGREELVEELKAQVNALQSV